jgi:hypothetical protein
MAEIKTIAPENLSAWEEWFASRPPVIQDMIRRYPATRLYRMADGHRATIYSYAEDGTVTVNVTGEYNRVLFSRQVFGIPIETLVECDLPGPDEDLGDTSQEAGYSEEDVRNILIPQIREDMIRRGELPRA